jgi:hypothetical protein
MSDPILKHPWRIPFGSSECMVKLSPGFLFYIFFFVKEELENNFSCLKFIFKVEKEERK